MCTKYYDSVKWFNLLFQNIYLLKWTFVLLILEKHATYFQFLAMDLLLRYLLFLQIFSHTNVFGLFILFQISNKFYSNNIYEACLIRND